MMLLIALSVRVFCGGEMLAAVWDRDAAGLAREGANAGGREAEEMEKETVAPSMGEGWREKVKEGLGSPDQTVVLGMVADPEPDQVVALSDPERAVVDADAG